MKFAISLLILLALVCSIISAVPQGQSYEWYAGQYSKRIAGWILALHLDDGFHSIWFAVLAGLLCLSLLMCNLIRLPKLLEKMMLFGAAGDSEKLFYKEKAEGITAVSSVFETLTFLSYM